MRTYTTNEARRNAATLTGLVLVALALFGSHDVGRTFTTRQLNERYSAEDVIGESTRRRDALEGLSTGGQGLAFFKREVFGAGEATVHGLIQALVGQPIANPNLQVNNESSTQS